MPGIDIDNQSGRLWIEEGQQRTGLVAAVAPLIPVHQTYSYAVPDSMVKSLALGQRVMIPIGRSGRLVPGFVIELDHGLWKSTLRPIASLVDDESYLTEELITLGREIALHYACPLAQTLKAMTPEPVRHKSGMKTVRYAALLQPPPQILEKESRRLSPKRQALIDHLQSAEGKVCVDELLEACGASTSILRAMVKAGWVEVTTRKEIVAVSDPSPPLNEPDYELNTEQLDALKAVQQQIDLQTFAVTLLYGVSGSGKTEVYIHAMRRVLAQGKQAIMLVPEIVLTTQLVDRLLCRFENVAVMHSRLTGGQRSRIWRAIATGQKQVIIGTRSAVFAPCPNLGLICVDEEQESSYKNLQAPRFHVRDVAIMRAQAKGIPVVLGSATPSVEVWHRSTSHKVYQKVVIRRRVNQRSLPKVHLIDMRDEYAAQKQQVVFSSTMQRLLKETLDRGEQALILMNRRGFAHRIFCPECKTRVTCPHCQVGLVAHNPTGESVCHYCRTRMPTPKTCSNISCGKPLVHLGLGTQRVEDVIWSLFPDARIARVDSDTMKHRDHYTRIVDDFTAQRLDVLVGTQMIAKGLDFPFVSFVGVVDADATGLSYDFRAQERLFQLITQVAGRAGRADAPGQVVVQTASPDLPALKHAITHDYESFVADELALRRRVGLPPFRRLARMVISHTNDAIAGAEARSLTDRIRETIGAMSLDHAEVLGPNPCALARLRGKYRHDLLVLVHSATNLRELMTRLLAEGALKSKGSLMVDVDPVSMS